MLLTEVEAMLNTRPLLYVTPEDTQTALSPADFLQQHTSLGLSSLADDADNPDYQPLTGRLSTAEELLSARKKGQRLIDAFSQR